jgi:hypothetical protein
MTDVLTRVFGPEDQAYTDVWDQLEPRHVDTMAGMARGTARGAVALLMYSWFVGTGKSAQWFPTTAAMVSDEYYYVA